ncbi:histone deacetylase HosB [Talaromyces stipitatus ATCC 10500]|uniref:Histone deacetylase HosB n=1 Tax=Talaromyces stipitatus (strain ATCC 10500 / CBS 375.48 / QM 6759 / NRRL 1006) TaxID=441959 RepID=B8MDT7_TALSN|nr:histone deacetylase HosB [Talaromyces stipitatus ATCC 10500]EED18316.1 histone deacetylase HosB [Talaromyces stipitatus ATCC 10500]
MCRTSQALYVWCQCEESHILETCQTGRTSPNRHGSCDSVDSETVYLHCFCHYHSTNGFTTIKKDRKLQRKADKKKNKRRSMDSATSVDSLNSTSTADMEDQNNHPARSPDEPPLPTMTAHNLAVNFHRLSLATTTASPGSPLLASSPTPSPRSPSQASSRIRNASSSVTPASLRSKTPSTLRKTPSNASLRDERRLSTPSLQKRASTSSLRSVSLSREQGVASSLSRRSSSNVLGTMYSTKSPIPAVVEAPTASSIASDHFKAELALHESVDLQSKTAVIIQDACYGHRFSRPYTSKEGLSTIVERPERLRASLLGMSTAYVRVGKRHAGASFAPRPGLNVDLLPPPPFQIRKSKRAISLNSPAVTYVHGDKWMEDLRAMCNAAESRLALNGREIVRPRSAGKKDPEEKPLHDGDLYLCPESLDAFQGALGGVCDAVDIVLTDNSTNRAFVCVRPPGHHCASTDPSGFCWLNNVHVGITHAAMVHGLTHAAIIDFDLHHGDGSQAIAYKQNEHAWYLQQRGGAAARNAAQHKKTAVGYYSLHDINSFPCENGEMEKIVNASVCIDNAHGQSIWNAHLEPWKTHEEFWKLYNDKYLVLLDKARSFLRSHTQRLDSIEGGPAPKAAIFISAGFDASEYEGAGMQRHKVNVPTDFYARFTADVIRLAEEEGLGTEGRVISVLEGGYSNRALASGVLSHLSALADTRTFSDAADRGRQSGLASEMSGRLGLGGETGQDSARGENTGPAFETEWWAPELLDELELLAFPPPVAKKTQKSAPTYFSPTHASTARVTTTLRERKSSANFAVDDYSPEPLPEVGWATSAHELWKCVIPSDRETLSFQYDELKARAVEAKKKKQTNVEPPATPSGNTRRQLRARTSKPTSPDTPVAKAQTPRRVSARNNRRTTIGSASDLPEPLTGPKAAKPERRRQSAIGAVSEAENTPGSGSRTPTRASSRLSSTPSQAPAGPVVNKKTRVSSGTPKRSASPRKVPPLPKVPSLYMNNLNAPSTSSRASSQSGEDAAKVNGNAETENRIDDLSAGMKKMSLKLKVPSPEENALREKKAAEQRKKAATAKKATTSKPAASKAARNTKLASKAANSAAGQSQPARNVLTKLEKGNEYEVPIKAEVPSTTPTSSAPVDTNKEVSVKLEPEDISPSMDSYQGFCAPATGLTSQQINLPLSPLSPLGLPSAPAPGNAPSVQPHIMVQPPASVMSGQANNGGLPVFSSTGHIPFAMRFPQGDQIQYPQSQFQQQLESDPNYQYHPHDGSVQQHSESA